MWHNLHYFSHYFQSNISGNLVVYLIGFVPIFTYQRRDVDNKIMSKQGIETIIKYILSIIEWTKMIYNWVCTSYRSFKSFYFGRRYYNRIFSYISLHFRSHFSCVWKFHKWNTTLWYMRFLICKREWRKQNVSQEYFKYRGATVRRLPNKKSNVQWQMWGQMQSVEWKIFH